MAVSSGFAEEFRLLSAVERLAPAMLGGKKGGADAVCANVDLYSGLVYKMLGIPDELFTPLFAVARMAGWCAHRIEEVMTCRRIVRPAYKTIQGNRTVCSACMRGSVRTRESDYGYGKERYTYGNDNRTQNHRFSPCRRGNDPGQRDCAENRPDATQDATGTMAYLQFEAMGIDRVKTELSVAYIDHNTLQNGFENADDHRYIQTVAKSTGCASRPGNGICHQVHLERFGIPRENAHRVGQPYADRRRHRHAGFGAGGLTWPVAMGGGAYCIEMPHILRVNLTGSLSPWVSAKDVILELLRRLSVKGGVGKIIEYGGKAWRRSPSPSARPSRIWAPSWAPPPPFSRRTRSRARL